MRSARVFRRELSVLDLSRLVRGANQQTRFEGPDFAQCGSGLSSVKTTVSIGLSPFISFLYVQKLLKYLY